MVQYYTLEQAAKILHTTVDKLKEMAKNGEVRPFQDRGNLRFRSQEINELARAKGYGSDPGLQLGDVIPLAEGPSTPKPGAKSPAPTKASPPEDAGAVFDFTLTTDESGMVPLADPPSGPRSGSPSSAARKKTPSPRPSTLKAPPPMVSSDSDVRLVADGSDIDFKISDEPPRSPSPSRPKKGGSSGGKSKLAPPARRDSEVHLGSEDLAHDSDVKLVGDRPADSSVGVDQFTGKKPSDSDIRMDHGDLLPPSSKKLRKEVITEEIDLDAEFKKAEEASRARGISPPNLNTGHAPQLPTSSPYDLSDEDVKLAAPKSAPPKPKSGPPKSAPAKSAPPKSGPKTGPRTPPVARKEAQEDESSDEFTLAPALKDDSSGEASPLEPGSDEVPLMMGGDEEVSLGELSGVAGGSGINLQLPADSGISLEQGGSDEIEFELSLDPSDESKSLVNKGDKPAKTGLGKDQAEEEEGPSDFELSLKEEESDSDSESGSDSEFELTLDGEESVEPGPIVKDDSESESESEFELTLDDSGSGKLAAEDEAGGLAGDEEQDIFETDFEVPSLEEEDSGSGAMSLESDTDVETSDFDLSSVESDEGGAGSQVVELDDDAADSGAATVKRPARKGKAAIADEAEVETDAEELIEPEEEEEEAVRTVAVEAAPAEWGPLPALVLLPCVLILFVVGLMGFELVQGMWGYHRGSKVPGLIIDPIARMIDDSLPKNE